MIVAENIEGIDYDDDDEVFYCGKCGGGVWKGTTREVKPCFGLQDSAE